MTLFKVFLVILGGCFAFDEKIRMTDFYECEEMLANTEDIKQAWPISCLWNNEINDDEVLRMKLFVLGMDLHIELGVGEDFEKVHHGIYISGNIGNPNWAIKSGIAEVTGREWGPAQEAITTNLMDSFFYTELYLVVTKGNVIMT